ncbi:hypothetical protein VPHK436_0004 [Vibrio phage K436]
MTLPYSYSTVRAFLCVTIRLTSYISWMNALRASSLRHYHYNY